MKKVLLGLIILCPIPSYALDILEEISEEISDDKTRFFWYSNRISTDIVRKLLILVNKALDYKVQSAYFYDALEEIARLVDSIDMKADEKIALQSKIASLIKVLSDRSHHEIKSIVDMKKELGKSS